MGRSNFSFDKRRRELDKKKKQEAKREVRAERKATGEPSDVPVVRIDEWGNAVEDDGK